MTQGRHGGMAFVALLLSIGLVTPSSAQGFISPFAGFDFGGHSRCAVVSIGAPPLCARFVDRDDGKLHVGASFGILGSVLGEELEIGYGRDFTVEFEGRSSGVLTVMGNAMIAPRLGTVRPYALAGLGLIKTRSESDQVRRIGDNHFGWNVGGGLIGSLGEHLGLRGDIRYFQTADGLQETGGLTIEDTKLSFGRVSGGIVVMF